MRERKSVSNGVRLKSTVTGGSTTNFSADLLKYKGKDERCASAVRIRTSISGNVCAQWSEVCFALFSDMDKSINNLPLFLFGVKTTEVSFQCTRRSHPPKNQRVFLVAGPRSKSQPRASYQRPENGKKNRLVETRFTWEPQSITVQSDSFAGLTNHVSMRPDKHCEEEVVQDIMKPAEQRLNCTVTGGSTVK